MQYDNSIGLLVKFITNESENVRKVYSNKFKWNYYFKG